MHARSALFLGLAGVAAGWAVARSVRRPWRLAGRTVVITGGSRGLGLELAREFGRQGARLALLARDEEELDRAVADLRGRGAVVSPFVCDLRRRDQAAQVVGQVLETFGRIDVLVNNAGVIQVAPLANLTMDDFEAAMDVHLFGPLALTLAVLPHLRAQGGGRIVNVTSIGGKIAVPHLLPYTASKFALVGLSDGLRAELRRENILVTTVVPGLMRTGSPPNALFKGRHREEYAWFAIADSLPGLSVDSRRAARQVVAACRRGETHVTLGLATKVALLTEALAPGVFAHAAAWANRLLPEAGAGNESHLGWESESRWTQSFLTGLSRAATARNNEQIA